MSTRTNIIIEYGKTSIYLYRHHDGYLAETGANIHRVLSAHKPSILQTTDILKDFLDQSYPKTEYRDSQPIYEITNSVHGDIEFLYRIKMDGETIKIQYVSGYGDLEQKIENSKILTLDQFKTAINQEIELTNIRISDLNKTNQTNWDLYQSL